MAQKDDDDSTSGSKRAYSAPALEKGIQILELFAAEPRGLTISEIAQKLGRSISEVFRIIIVMERLGWLAKDPVNDRYTVTYRVLDVAFRATPAQTLSNVAAPVMYELSSATNQSCHLVVETGGRATVIHRQENMGPVGFGIRLGTVVDLVTSCSGHVLLAFAAQDRRAKVICSLGIALDFQTRLEQRLDAVRLQGYEMQPSARTAGVTDISFPVFGFDGHVCAALTVPFLVTIDGSQKTGLEETREVLGRAALDISAGLGWSQYK
ncbi:IclR family transcriptional regulator [Novosphingobium resinovorum]|jgi:DNA-binding IclR family transcriptional regulator|uniref:IclR family transcriptional regulator n=2 Tax=Novosphingobium TaxID=165696 RepID=UPI0025A19C46|nr:IclR family transcriptional regulator [Novosphingobium resinovorum]WJM25307.1 IclR family transcriptional regulator [Novosphingobium resinovorum]